MEEAQHFHIMIIGGSPIGMALGPGSHKLRSIAYCPGNRYIG